MDQGSTLRAEEDREREIEIEIEIEMRGPGRKEGMNELATSWSPVPVTYVKLNFVTLLLQLNTNF